MHGPGKLSSYVLEEEVKRGNQGEMVGSDDRETDEFDTKELSATVLDKGEEITSLYRYVRQEKDLLLIFFHEGQFRERRC